METWSCYDSAHGLLLCSWFIYWDDILEAATTEYALATALIPDVTVAVRG